MGYIQSIGLIGLLTMSAFCMGFDGGFPSQPPPVDPIDQIAYNNMVYLYLQDSLKHNNGYRTWTHDKYWRFTGKLTNATVPIDGKGAILADQINKGSQYGVHPPCRIYYSPAVFAWMKNDYKGVIPDGAVIIKETMGWNTGVQAYAETVAPADRLKLAAAGETTTVKTQIEGNYSPTSWVVMVRNSKASLDGWYWFDFTVPGQETPEMPYNYNGLSAYTQGFEAMPASPSAGWQQANTTPAVPGYWTGNSTGSIVYPSYGYGYYCFNCHASAIDQLTFSDLNNVEGTNTIFPVTIAFKLQTPALAGGWKKIIEHTLHKGDDEPEDRGPSNPYIAPLDDGNHQFMEIFGRFVPWKDVTWKETWESRLPARSYNHTFMNPEKSEQFLTSDQCQPCHDASMLNSSTPNMLVDGGERNISPFGEWEFSMMGLAGRDPIFYSQLEGETNYYSDAITGDITNTCFSCHGVMGQRQYHLDGNSHDFTRAMAAAWPGSENKQYAKYGSLARDGVSCTVCHHIVEEGLGTPATFTGKFKVGPPDEIYGPYENVILKPMEHAVGITPKYGSWMPTSKLCGSCHVVVLPVLYKDGKPVLDENQQPKTIHEQTTYLEWRNSIYNDENGVVAGQTKSCQDCHMKQTYEGKEVSAKIANIEASTASGDFPFMERALPNEELTLEVRSPFYRHQLTGINLFGMELFSQFPLITGIMQLDYQNFLTNGLLETQNTMAEMARTETVVIDSAITIKDNVLQADVTVNNLVGHFFPSGVGFRRAFLNVVVLDKKGNQIWASGNTNEVGVLVDEAGEMLPTEFLETDPRTGLNHQPHYKEIKHSYQVQIYESLYKDPYGKITTSFLGLDHHIKDNRIRPVGWSPEGPYADVTRPYGRAVEDPNYTHKDETGKDQVRYVIPLTNEQAANVGLVRVSLYYQATPPYYLMERFKLAKLKPDAKFNDIKRFWFMAAHLNTQDSASKIKDWKLLVKSVDATPRR